LLREIDGVNECAMTITMTSIGALSKNSESRTIVGFHTIANLPSTLLCAVKPALSMGLICVPDSFAGMCNQYQQTPNVFVFRFAVTPSHPMAEHQHILWNSDSAVVSDRYRKILSS
jgi:hypothetical protein